MKAAQSKAFDYFGVLVNFRIYFSYNTNVCKCKIYN